MEKRKLENKGEKNPKPKSNKKPHTQKNNLKTQHPTLPPQKRSLTKNCGTAKKCC